MLTESLIRRTGTGVLTTASGGSASCAIKSLNGLLEAVEVVLGSATGATIAIVNDQGVTLFSKAVVASGQFVPGNTISDGTNNAPARVPLFGDVTINITSGGNAKTLAVNLYFR